MNKTVLITGAAVRVGKAIALELATAGWDVVIHYRNSHKEAEQLAAEIQAKGRKAHLAQSDLQDSAQVSRLIPQLTEKGVHLDCLVNNASLFEKDALATVTHDGWGRQMDVNCFAPVQLIRDFAAQYQGNDGNVINIADGLEGWSMSPVFFSYTMSKRALMNATQLLVRVLAPRIRINVVAPGATLESALDKQHGTFAKLEKIVPLGHNTQLQEVCDTVRYIIGAPSLTGQVLSLAGGIHTQPQWAV